ncbi:MAG TPA: GNAT family protein [Aliidongia sp.]|nr:GNAT family protein [Aliidongia sp.]
MKLVEAGDAYFAWMLEGEGAGTRDGLRLPSGGVDHPAVLAYLQRIAADLSDRPGGGSWLVVDDGEVAGLCGHKQRPTPEGDAEIGYGIVASRRGRGLATAAVAALVDRAARDAAIARLTAETAVDNIASQRVLEKNGFVRAGTRTDPEDGPLLLWWRAVR